MEATKSESHRMDDDATILSLRCLRNLVEEDEYCANLLTLLEVKNMQGDGNDGVLLGNPDVEFIPRVVKHEKADALEQGSISAVLFAGMKILLSGPITVSEYEIEIDTRSENYEENFMLRENLRTEVLALFTALVNRRSDANVSFNAFCSLLQLYKDDSDDSSHSASRVVNMDSERGWMMFKGVSLIHATIAIFRQSQRLCEESTAAIQLVAALCSLPNGRETLLEHDLWAHFNETPLPTCYQEVTDNTDVDLGEDTSEKDAEQEDEQEEKETLEHEVSLNPEITDVIIDILQGIMKIFRHGKSSIDIVYHALQTLSALCRDAEVPAFEQSHIADMISAQFLRQGGLPILIALADSEVLLMTWKSGDSASEENENENRSPSYDSISAQTVFGKSEMIEKCSYLAQDLSKFLATRGVSRESEWKSWQETEQVPVEEGDEEFDPSLPFEEQPLKQVTVTKGRGPDPNHGPSIEQWRRLLDIRTGFPRFSIPDGSTALLASLSTNLPEIAIALANAGADINICDEVHGKTPLMLALVSGLEDVAALFLEDERLDVDAIDRYGANILQHAFVTPVRSELLAITTASRRTGSDGIAIPASIMGNPRLVDLITAKTSVDLNIPDNAGSYPIHWISCGVTLNVTLRSVQVELTHRFNFCGPGMSSRELLKSLTSQASCNLDNCDHKGNTALHAAIMNGNIDLAFALLEAGANPNIRDHNGNLPLHFACMGLTQDTKELVQALIQRGERIPVMDGDFVDLGLVGLPQWEKKRRAVDRILEEGLEEIICPRAIRTSPLSVLELCSIKNNNGKTPLHIACSGKGILAEDLDTSPEIDTKVLTDNVLTYFDEILPERIAIEEKAQVEISVANLPAITRKQRFSAVMGILSSIHSKEERKRIVNLRDDQGRTSLHSVAESSQDKEEGISSSEFCSLLIDTGATLDILEHNGLTPLHLALCKGRDLAWTLLSAHNAKLVYQDASVPLLQLAVRLGDIKLVGYILMQSQLMEQNSIIPEEAKSVTESKPQKIQRMNTKSFTLVHIESGLKDLKQKPDERVHVLSADDEKVTTVNICGDPELLSLHKLPMYYSGTALMVAAQFGHISMLQAILEYPGILVNISRPTDGKTALHVTCATNGLKDQARRIEILIDAGADVLSKDDSGRNPLFYLVDSNGLEGIDILWPHVVKAAGSSLVAELVDNQDLSLMDYIANLSKPELSSFSASIDHALEDIYTDQTDAQAQPQNGDDSISIQLDKPLEATIIPVTSPNHLIG